MPFGVQNLTRVVVGDQDLYVISDLDHERPRKCWNTIVNELHERQCSGVIASGMIVQVFFYGRIEKRLAAE